MELINIMQEQEDVKLHVKVDILHQEAIVFHLLAVMLDAQYAHLLHQLHVKHAQQVMYYKD